MCNVNNVIVIFVCFISQISAHCGPGQKFSPLAPCQATCEKEKPIICIRRPGCYCVGEKIWDKIQKKCVFKADCLEKPPKSSGTHRLGVTGTSTSIINKKGTGFLSPIKSLISIPFKIPSTIFKNVRGGITKAILFKLKVIRIPWTIGTSIFETFSSPFKKGFSWIYEKISKIFTFDANFVIGIIHGIKGVFGWIVKEFASIDINIVQFVKNIYNFGTKSAEGTVGGVIKFWGWGLSKIGHTFEGGLNILHIKGIFKGVLNLPIIKIFSGIIEKIKKGEYHVVLSQFKDLGNLYGGIVNQHRNFFDPIFSTINNNEKAIFQVITTLFDTFNFHGISKVIGKLENKINFKDINKSNNTTVDKSEKPGFNIGTNFNGFGLKGNPKNKWESKESKGWKEPKWESGFGWKGESSSKENSGSKESGSGSKEWKLESGGKSKGKGKGKSKGKKGDYSKENGHKESGSGSKEWKLVSGGKSKGKGNGKSKGNQWNGGVGAGGGGFGGGFGGGSGGGSGGGGKINTQIW